MQCDTVLVSILVKKIHKHPLKIHTIFSANLSCTENEPRSIFVETMSQWTESRRYRGYAQLLNSWNRPIDYKNRWANQSGKHSLGVVIYVFVYIGAKAKATSLPKGAHKESNNI